MIAAVEGLFDGDESAGSGPQRQRDEEQGAVLREPRRQHHDRHCAHQGADHGGSGTDDGDFTKAISAGITIVHISTELRLAWRRGIEVALAGNSDEVVPYKIYGNSLAVTAVAEERLRLFNIR
jgi:fructose/tagatose bisphosphate aldolase